MAYFPFFMELECRPGLIVGGGAVALRKVEKLLPYGPRLTVVAPRFCPELEARPDICRLRRPFRPEDVEGMTFVIAATGDPDVNHQVAAVCREHRIPVNVVDDRDACTFLFPALVQRGSLSVGISTGGASPTAAVHLKEQIDALLPDRFEEILDYLEGCRETIRREVPGEADRARIYASLFRSCLAQNGPCTDHQLRAILEEVRHVP